MTDADLAAIEQTLAALDYRDDAPELYELAGRVPALIAEVRRLRQEHEDRRAAAARRWAYPPILDIDRANEEVRRLRAYIAEWASSQWDGDREQRYRDDPVWLKAAWHSCSKFWGEAAMEAHHLRADVATLKRQIDVLVGFLVAYAPDCAPQLKFYVLERDRLVAQVRDLKREIGAQNAANRRHKDEVARLRAALGDVAGLEASVEALRRHWEAERAEVARLRAALGEYADRSRWQSVAIPLENGNVRLAATFDGGWGVAEPALGE